MASVLSNFTTGTVTQANATPKTAGLPSQWATRIMTTHGEMVVRSRYDATRHQWTHTMPSHSMPGSYRHVTGGRCDCFAGVKRRTCWHLTTARSVEASIHLILWDVLSSELVSWSSTDAYGRGMATLRRMSIPTDGCWGSREAAIQAMEVLAS